MEIRARRAFGQLGAALLALLTPGALACLPTEPSDTSAGGSAGLPTELRGVVVEGFRDDAREFEVRAASASVEMRERLARLRRVEIAFEDPVRGHVQLRADEGRLPLDRDEFVLEGNVAGSSSGGERFETSRLYYGGEQRRLWTDQPVRVERGSLLLTGRGMELDLEDRRIRFTGRVQATTGPR